MRRSFACLLLVLAAPTLHAQADRFELGQRLRTFERAYDAQPAAAARKQTVAPLLTATNKFFSLQFGAAGQALDRATFALTGRNPDAPVAWAASLYAQPATRFFSRDTPTLTVTVKSFYDAGKKPDGLIASLQLFDEAGIAKTELVEKPVGDLPLTFELRTANVPEGDLQLRLLVRGPGVELPPTALTVSVAARLKERLDALDALAQSLPGESTTVERLTLKSRRAQLRDLAENKVPETNLPAYALLREAERVAAAAKAGEFFYGQGKAGQFWLTLPAGKANAYVRLQAPAGDKKPRPLVLALHGAGGSENMFFDGYGDGAVAKLAGQRGWLIAAPRSAGFTRGAPLADLVDAIDKLYPVDRKRVYVVGHSMGAAQAVGAASATPQVFAGVAALGGGGGVQATEALKLLPFFVGVGKQDFALRGAQQLVKSLQKAEVAQVVVKEYDDVEHLVVVQLALPEVFKWFDGLTRK